MGDRGDSWCFTIPNYTDEVLLHLQLLFEGDPRFAYAVVGREVAPTTGTPHLQGYVRLRSRIRFASLRALLPQCHLSRARGTPQQNFDYCSKDGNFDEWGTRPAVSQGRRTDFEEFRDWLRGLDHQPSDLELIDEFPSLYGRYRSALRDMAQQICPRPELRDGVLRPWQAALLGDLAGEPDDRTVRFFVDPDGGSGKSWFCGYVFSRIEHVQLLGPGKRDDLAHIVDVRSRVFLINVPRGGAEFLNYGFLEMLKDRMVLSPKYASQMKILLAVPHVVVFMNEPPDETKMTADRYVIEYLS